MNCLHVRASAESAAKTLVILLPGAYNRAAEFLSAGFGEIAHGKRFDLTLPDLDLTQLSSGDALPLLHHELIAPARASGVKTIWLGGTSLGGFNSLVYADTYPNDIDGLCLLAPWPGSRISRRLIETAGGLERWSPSAQELKADAELRVWHWLRAQKHAATQLPVFIGWGNKDRFASGIAAYAEQMPEADIASIPGGHDWPVWASLWQRFCTQDINGIPPKTFQRTQTA